MTFRAWQAVMVALVFAILAAAASMAYATRVARDSERKWCGLVSTLDDAYQQTPPQTPAGRQVAADVHRLRGQFDCR